MAAEDFAGLAEDVAALLTDCGQAVILRSDAGDTSANAVVLDYGSRERDGELILPNDRNALIVPVEDVTPDPEEHRLVIGLTSFRIVSVRTVAPNGTVLYHDCQIRA